ncbi:uncharacterized protein NECHADRAFT_78065 [Fusarium vanettenii 77-13-4]|uniref:Protein kinase domain-containing protein n=1 Tax=Fusarium vanettenii (strain ATCC MYA-4622 / CBS 123669 / FGSC 9596 / NRRL 45880 / 77-13-4) TaxID=660122 RepID=C7YN08_FUSV7|nr:uncharacterized protein NECHADRAFT_78065 [Fusarium vanettenii 77-13-4]EEU47043.1 hypothetical protein NECHADRAFT_78065 [Fusarium vanettenii 77-13-4]
MTGFADNDADGASVRSDDSFRFLPAQVGDTEELELYQEGGFHPVHLGDLYDDGRYRIVHKLGAGGFSTVWLASDCLLSSWVALKIVVADKSPVIEEKAVMCHKIASHWSDGRFITYKRYFYIEGPNGRHLCLVLPPCGPSLHVLSHYLRSRVHPWLSRRAAFQAAKATADLHSRGLYITPSNIVFRLRNLDHLDDQGIYRLFGEPRTGPLETCSGDIPGPEAPRYIVGYLDFMSSREDLLLDDISLIDFDQAFLTSGPPEETLGTPVGFLAPEVAVGKPASPASDVWALGCTILHIRSGSSPFSTLDVDCPANLTRCIIEYIGEIPTSWEGPLFDDDGQPTTDKSRGMPLRELSTTRNSLRQWVSEIWDQPTNLDETQSSSAMVVEDENKPYPKCYDSKFWKPAAIRIDDTYLGGYCDKVDRIIGSLPKISAHEVDLLFDLLSQIFVYEPAQRVGAGAMLAHPWFHMDNTV